MWLPFSVLRVSPFILLYFHYHNIYVHLISDKHTPLQGTHITNVLTPNIHATHNISLEDQRPSHIKVAGHYSGNLKCTAVQSFCMGIYKIIVNDGKCLTIKYSNVINILCVRTVQWIRTMLLFFFAMLVGWLFCRSVSRLYSR